MAQYTCSKCGRDFTKLSSLRNHEKACIRGPLRCPHSECSYEAKKKSHIDQHISRCPHNPSRKVEHAAPSDDVDQQQQSDSQQGRDITRNSASTHQPPPKKPAAHPVSMMSMDDFTNPRELPNPGIVHDYKATILKDNRHALKTRFTFCGCTVHIHIKCWAKTFVGADRYFMKSVRKHNACVPQKFTKI